ncbi:DUF167 domain-containing protein [Candidatus Peregrinibacteria bacterium]|nr:DUF167 domain-containing protein [Candidatus Peregrinibacteria bacterium]
MTNDQFLNKFFIQQIIGELQKKNPLYIKVKVQSKAPKTEIADQMEDGTYKIKVAAQPVRGAANAELLKFLKKNLGLSDSQIVSGGRDSVKLIRLTA